MIFKLVKMSKYPLKSRRTKTHKSLRESGSTKRDLDLDELDLAIEDCLEFSRKAINKERLTRISDQCHVFYNSVNVLCGRQGSGKTFTSMKESIKISMVSPETHLLVIICKDENSTDPTVEALKPLLRIPVVYVKEDEAEDFVKNLLSYKRFYDLVKSEHIQDQLEDEQVVEVFDNLYITDWKRKWLHTLFLFNDIAKSKLFKRADGYFNQLIPICRHIQCSFFLNVQFWKSIPTEIKANITTAFIFGGFSKEQLRYITRQLPVNVSFDEIYDVYLSMGKNDKLIINAEEGDVKYSIIGEP